jgi:hypothetical protein
MPRFDYRTKFKGLTLEELKELLPHYKEQYWKYLGGHPECQTKAFKDLIFLENKIKKIESAKT